MKKRPFWLKIVISVCAVGLTAAIVYPIFATAKVGGGPSSVTNAKTCALGIQLYATDFDDLFPYVQSREALMGATRSYVKDDRRWQTRNPGRPGLLDYNHCLPGGSLKQVTLPAETPMLFDPYGRDAFPGNSSGERSRFLVVYVDAHARYVPEKQWVAAQPLLRLSLTKHGQPIK